MSCITVHALTVVLAFVAARQSAPASKPDSTDASFELVQYSRKMTSRLRSVA